jgi:hypothetical protein
MKFVLKNLLALVVGVGACVGGWYVGKSSMTKLFSWTDAIGQIQEYTTGNSDKRTNPRVAFKYQGKDYQFVQNGFSSDNADNRTVIVIFPKDNPSQAEIRQWGWLLGVPALLFVFGLVFVAIGVTAFVRRMMGLKGPTPEELDAQRVRMDALRATVQEKFKKS